MTDQQLSKTFPVKPKLKPKPRTQKQTRESKHWSSYKTQQIPDLFSAVNSIAFSPSASTFAAAYSASVKVFSSDSLSPVPASAFSSFRDVVTSVSYRSDGLLLAAADLSGQVQVFDVKSRNPLRKLRGHSRPVRFVKYPALDKLHLVSGGDDSLVKYWDVATEKPLSVMLGHRDYVRSGDFSPSADGVFATGSYDHTVRLWDARLGGSRSVLDFDHGAPVEDVVFLPSGGLIATAGGNSVKIWDVLAGGRLVGSMESHNKTVTCLCVAAYESDKHRLVSVGLDGYLKVLDYGDMKVTHSARFPAPLMSVAFSPDSTTRAIGTSNGTIFAGKRKKTSKRVETEKRAPRPGQRRYFERGQGEKASEGDFRVEKRKSDKKKKVAEHERLLRKFRHREALVAVLKGKNPEATVAVMEELVARKKLLKCASNLEGAELALMLGFLGKYVTAAPYARLLTGLAAKLVEARADDLRADGDLVSRVRNLKRAVDEEIRIQLALQQIQGLISPLLRLAAPR